MKSKITNILDALDKFNIISVSDLDGKIKYANDNLCKISGYSREELIGKPQSTFNSDYHHPDYWRDLWATIQSANIWQGEIRNKDKIGNYYWVFTTIVPIIDDLGKPKEYFTLRIDITEKKQKEEELLTNRQNLRAIFNTSRVESYLLGQNYEIIDANLTAQSTVKRIWGRDILIGERVLEYITEEYQEQFKQNYQQALMGKEVQYETEVNYQDLSIWYEVSYTPITDFKQEVYAVLYNRDNISDKKNRLKKIEKHNETLRKIADISSHDIRGPVASLLGLLQLFDKSELENSLNQELMEHMDTMTKQLDQVIHQIVEMTYQIDD